MNLPSIAAIPTEVPAVACVELDSGAVVHVAIDQSITTEASTVPIMPVYAVIHEDGIPVNERWTTLAFLAAVAEGAAAAIAEAQ
jgi:hypothetical protein